MESRFDHQELEKNIYKEWESSGFFNPDTLDISPDAEPYTIIMPPPNANGSLHAGHALFITLQDILTRYNRMKGKKALWVPGADHAGFETQIVYEKKLEKEGRSRFGMDRDDLYKEILDFTLENKSIMEGQVRSLGASCDWSREKFTLDEDVVRKTQEVFQKMYDDDLVYRAKRPVNWCTKHQTSLSDVETETVEKDDVMYHVQYGPLVVATVRPETFFGDVAVAVHPEDARYKGLVGTTITTTVAGKELSVPVIGDEAVDPEFGTGALKITPGHSKDDFEIGKRHDLPTVEAIDQYGKLTEVCGEFAGLGIVNARKAVVEKLKEEDILIKEEKYAHQVPVCYKCNRTIEPRLIDQWYVKMEPLAKLALDAVNEGKISFTPDRYRKIFTYWMENTIDWNISRQIVWGIPIPAKICDSCGEGYPDLDNKLSECSSCKGVLRSDTDTFDTWFSSGQWPYLALNYPESDDFKTFYPTSVMETGDDLIFKWIPRMVIFGLYIAGDVPFSEVYLHGLVNDDKGKKMSKSKGNVTNPLELTEKYGTDALRMGLVVGNAPGSSIALSESKIKGYRNFSTKMWNMARFILGNRPENFDPSSVVLTEIDKDHIAEAEKMRTEVGRLIDSFDMHLAAEESYHYTWHTVADKLIEEAKPRLTGDDEADKAAAYLQLETIFMECLTMLHPFMPFVTEALYKEFSADGLLMVKMWDTSRI